MAEVRTVEDRREFGSTRLRGRIWWIRYRLDGREHWESSHSTSEREAEKLLAQRQAERQIGHFTAPDVRRTTVSDLAQMLRDDYRINGHRSLKRAENSLTHLLAAFGGSRATTVTADRIAAYIRDRLDDKAAPSTIR
ncbi:MAG TPA: hypothetical protein VE420_07340, partial [Gemmatimonadales bacterium]|nr:hypothetical protein [Gemmatimonadales bacterium]